MEEKVAQNVFDKSLNDSQFGVSAVPYHTHNGTDSPQISYNSLTDKPSSSFSAGMIMMYGSSTAPSGWLACDGSAVSRTTYATLFGIISTTYGAGDGSTTFNVPDMRGRSPMGNGTGTGGGSSGTGKPTGGSALTNRAMAAWVGEETHTLTTTELASHNHGVKYNGTNAGTNSVLLNTALLVNGAQTYSTVGDLTTNAGSDGAHNTMHPTMTVAFIIKT